MAKAKVVAINKEKEVSDAIDALQVRWDKYKKQDYSSSALRTAVERIVSAAEEMMSSLDGVPFGFTIEDTAPNSIRVAEEIHQLAEALDPKIKRELQIADQLEDDFEPSRDDVLAHFKWRHLCDTHDDARYNASDAAFHVGIIFGAHLVGATPEQIARLKKGLIRHWTLTVGL